MVNKFTFGAVEIETEAVIENIFTTQNILLSDFNYMCDKNVHIFTKELLPEQAVYGLGEQVRGINKRGWHYTSFNEDDPIITEGRTSLYASHNFILIDGQKPLGAFFDFAGKVEFDVGFSDPYVLQICCHGGGNLYIVKEDSLLSTVKRFRKLIGMSYIPPRWAFGYGQSRWGYKSCRDILDVVQGFRKNNLPVDMIYLDIDYMNEFADFTVDENVFPKLNELVFKLKEQGIKLVPIIDAAVKVKKGYSVYEEGLKKNYFCTDADGNAYVIGVWPQDSVLPDVANPDVRDWFGSMYKFLLDIGFEGFWNDMNEPTYFYALPVVKKLAKNIENLDENAAEKQMKGMALREPEFRPSEEQFSHIYHHVDGKSISHDKIHNLYGYFMVRACSDYLSEYKPDKRYLLFSRSSYIGMHRYGGIWTGDNCSWWSHILLNLQMLPSLNMCGFLYCGADIGGFGGNISEDLLLRWMALGVFTPLMRNHSTLHSRKQEPYNFKNIQAFASVMAARYALLPFLYSKYIECALNNDMLFKPLGFVYPNDVRAKQTEDELIVGDSIIIAPVYTQNAVGRMVYLPQNAKLIRLKNGDVVCAKILSEGDHFVEMPLDEVVFFLLQSKVIPLSNAKKYSQTDMNNLSFEKYIDEDAEFTLCCDSGDFLSDIYSHLKTVVVRP